MKRTLYLMSSGQLGRKANTLVLESQDAEGNIQRQYFPIEQIREIHVFGEVSLNKRVLEFLNQKGVLIHFYNHYGYYSGTFYPKEHYNSGCMILRQAEHYLDHAKRIILARQFVDGALFNLLRTVKYYANRIDDNKLLSTIQVIERQRERLASLTSPEEFMQAEGQAWDAFYQAFDHILENEDFRFGMRTHRPPHNRINALISFGRSLLYTTILSEIYKTHLDPRIGYLHATNFRCFTLNLDVAEVFRPILPDRLVLTLVKKRQIQAKHFENSAGGIYLNGKGRRIFLEAWEERLKTTLYHRGLKRHVSYRRLIRLELYKLEKHLIGEQQYTPFRSRW